MRAELARREPGWLARWEAENRAYIASKKRFWLYN
jgi:hypothetical protein